MSAVYKFLAVLLTVFLAVVSSIGLEAYNKINPSQSNAVRTRTKQFLIFMSATSWIALIVMLVATAITSSSSGGGGGGKSGGSNGNDK
jgi:uncharacterized membrane protein